MSFNKNSLKNLKPIQKGEVRNPTGRPKTLIKPKELDEILCDMLSIEVLPGVQQIETIVKMLIGKAEAGDQKAAEFLIERYYGKVPNIIKADITQPAQIIGFNIIEQTNDDSANV